MLSTKNVYHLRQKHALIRGKAKLPRSIRDAIDLCSHLCFRYLWVDSLCIAQDDDLAKSAHIRHMDTIYQRASFTLVAAAGKDSNGGLLALHPEELRPCQGIVLRGLYLRESRTNWYFKSPNLPVWSTRAWTLQESVLSQRQIIFTDDSIFFSTLRSTYIYDPSVSRFLRVEKLLLDTNTGTQLIPRLGPHHMKDDVAWNFFYLLRDYLHRDLTDANDNLNAFTGIINMLTPRLGPCLYGVPVREIYWVSLFRITGKFCRVSLYPSWSWAGCKKIPYTINYRHTCFA
jgi:heterokaryon incompatibility protein (HET)